MITETKLAIFAAVSASTSVTAVISDQTQTAIVAAISAVVAAIPAIIIALRGTNQRILDAAIETKKQFEETKFKVEEKAVESDKKLEKVSEQLDGRLSKLIEEVSKAKLAEGKLEGLKEGAEIASAAKLTDALIAATPKAPVASAPDPIPASTPTPEPVPVPIAVVSMPDEKAPPK